MAEKTLYTLLDTYLPPEVEGAGPPLRSALLSPEILQKQDLTYHYYAFDRLRQAVTRCMTAATKQKTGVAALAQLQEAQLLINELYGNKRNQEIAQTVTTASTYDTEFSLEYFMLAEMARDIARFYWKVAEFSGQLVANSFALQWIERAYEVTAEDAYLHSLLFIEHIYTRAKLNEKLSDEDLDLAVEHLDFMYSYANHFAGGLERVADAAELLLYVALKQKDLGLTIRALKNITTCIGDLKGRINSPVELPIFIITFALKRFASVVKMQTAPEKKILLKASPNPQEFGKKQIESTPLRE